MNFQEKQVWCHATGSVLALAILLPPVGVQDGDEELRRETLPHIQHVREQEEQLQSELRKKQGKRDRPWPDATPVYGRAQMLRDTKFSLSYAESGLWYEARELMLVVDEYLVKSVGLDDAVSIRARLFLSETYWWLGEPDEAVRLQEELLAACLKSFGEDHTQTLNVSDRLGASFWQQGKFHKARELAQKAVYGFHEVYPTGHVDKSRALTNLGRCCGKLADFDQAVELHVEALEGLESAQKKKAEGQYGDQILEVMENLAMARHDRQRYGKAQPDDLQEAQRLQSEVLKAHPTKES